MPRSAKLQDEDTGTVHAAAAAANGIGEEKLKGYVAEIEAEAGKIEAVMARARADCQPFADQIKAIRKEAAEHGIAKKPLAAKLRERSLMRKAGGCRDTLSEEQRAIYDEIAVKLRDLPLFAAAVHW